MTPATLRDTLLRAGRAVPVETFLHGRKPAEVAALRESMADISDWRGTLLVAAMVVLISAMHLIGREP